MQDHEKGVLYLMGIGLLIGLGKLLSSQEEITTRLVIGRSLLGAATSTIAGVALMQVPDLPLPALVGLGAGLGIIGSQYLEIWLKKKLEQR